MLLLVGPSHQASWLVLRMGAARPQRRTMRWRPCGGSLTPGEGAGDGTHPPATGSSVMLTY